MDKADGTVTAALGAGDYRLAIEMMVELYGDDIYSYCRRLLGNGDEASDVSQTVFVQAFQCIGELAGVRCVPAWLRAVARHRCLDRLKVLRRGARLHDDADPGELPDGQLASTVADRDPRVRKALDDCLDGLDARSRALLILRFHDERSFDEIGELTSERPGALRVRLSRALPRLRQCLERKGVQL